MVFSNKPKASVVICKSQDSKLFQFFSALIKHL